MDALKFPTREELKRREKRKALELLLKTGWAFIGINTKAEGVDLPDHLMARPVVGLNLIDGIVSLDADHQAEAALTFSSVVHVCKIPLDAIFMMHPVGSPDDALTFPESAPL